MSSTRITASRASLCMTLIATFVFGAVAVPATAATFAELQASVTAAAEGATVTVTGAVTVASVLVIPRTMTLDLNGFVLSTRGVDVAAGAILTIADTDADGDPATSGTLIADAHSAAATPGIHTSAAGVVITAGIVEARGGALAPGIGGHGSMSGPAGDGGTVTISGGTVSAYGGTSAPGIGGGSTNDNGWTPPGNAATVTITGGVVSARGGDLGAGIGGANWGNGGSTTVSGGDVSTWGGLNAAGIGGGQSGNGGPTIVTGGTVRAWGGYKGAGIGGGLLGDGATVVTFTGGTSTSYSGAEAAAIGGGIGGNNDGATVTIAAGATVTVVGNDPPLESVGHDAIGSGWNSDTRIRPYTDLIVAGTLNIPSGTFLRNGAGYTLGIEPTGRIVGGGTITGAGTINNRGVLSVGKVYIPVLGNNFLVTLLQNDPAVSPGSTTQRIMAASFDAVGIALPVPTRTGWYFDGWETFDGTRFTATSILNADITIGARWINDYLVPTASDASIVAGAPLSFTIAGFTYLGAPLGDRTADDVVLTSSVPTDVISGLSVSMTSAGDHVVTANLRTDPTVFGSTTVSVRPAAEASRIFASSATTVVAGQTASITVTEVDSFGNFRLDVSDEYDYSSDIATDTFAAAAVSVLAVGTHVITATRRTDPGDTLTLGIVVVAAAPVRLTISLDGATVQASNSIPVTLATLDAYGNPTGDWLYFPRFSSIVPTDHLSPLAPFQLSMTTTGTHFIFVTDTHGTGLSASARITVVPGAASRLVVTPSGVPEAGGTQSYTVVAFDQYGNSRGDATSLVTVTSSEPSDVAAAAGLSFTAAGARMVTVAMTDTPSVASSFAVVVAAGALDAIEITPVLTTVTAGASPLFSVQGYDEWGNGLGDVSSAVTFSSSESSDVADATDPTRLRFTTAGTRTISAFLTAAPSIADHYSLVVEPDAAAPTSLEFLISTPTVAQGGELTFQVTMFDPYGNVLENVTSQVTLTSDYAGDIVDGNTVRFPHASPHVITATMVANGVTLSRSVTVEVVPTPAAATSPAGSRAQLASTGSDVGGAVLLALLAIALGLTVRRTARRTLRGRLAG